MLIVLAMVCGCGLQPSDATKVGSLPTARGPVVNNTVYFVRNGKLVPVVRPGLPGAPLMPLWQLGYGVTDKERSAGLSSTLPGVGIVTGLPDPSLHEIDPPEAPPRAVGETGDSDTITLALQTTIRPEKWPRVWQAQIACTAQAIPGINQAELNIFDGRPGRTVRCADYRDLLSPAAN
ncbi:hypothetical protein [Actinomadura montaniterrae]|uniref:GerMN domain-containing protein n=1 Tax=Actinomadura montaniterrae TaxID=1803903 RepID=A0A6L3VT81_9ACTN|nr:hypothetical protein [Actinomadura montaniterrae]KAB2379254.1 hypothetical protein F9B16_21310 [Actinomadura montaniterrae]